MPLIAVGALFAAAAALLLFMLPDARRNAELAAIGGPFELVDSAGKTVRDSDFLGTYFLVYFGYTFCPDVCPTSLNTIAEAFERLPPNKLAHVVALFVSVDPERDHGTVLDEYTNNFHPRIKGLTGTRAELDAMVAKYRGSYRIAKGEDPDFYPVDHSALVYLMDDKGRYVTHFTHQTTVEKLAAKLNDVLPD